LEKYKKLRLEIKFPWQFFNKETVQITAKRQTDNVKQCWLEQMSSNEYLNASILPVSSGERGRTQFNDTRNMVLAYVMDVPEVTTS
jgi:hypothetical protein